MLPQWVVQTPREKPRNHEPRSKAPSTPAPRGCSLQRPGLSFLHLLLPLQAWVANYERPRMNANSLLASPTGLSPYLRFGCLSCRLFYYRLWDLYKKVRGRRGHHALSPLAAPRTSLLGQSDTLQRVGGDRVVDSRGAYVCVWSREGGGSTSKTWQSPAPPKQLI